MLLCICYVYNKTYIFYYIVYYINAYSLARKYIRVYVNLMSGVIYPSLDNLVTRIRVHKFDIGMCIIYV